MLRCWWMCTTRKPQLFQQVEFPAPWHSPLLMVLHDAPPVKLDPRCSECLRTKVQTAKKTTIELLKYQAEGATWKIILHKLQSLLKKTPICAQVGLVSPKGLQGLEAKGVHHPIWRWPGFDPTQPCFGREPWPAQQAPRMSSLMATPVTCEMRNSNHNILKQKPWELTFEWHWEFVSRSKVLQGMANSWFSRHECFNLRVGPGCAMARC